MNWAKTIEDAIISNDEPRKTAEQIDVMLGMNKMNKDAMPVHRYIADVSRATRILGDKDSLSTLMLQVNQFCKIKKLDKLNSPKDLAIGISAEASDLLRVFDTNLQTRRLK